MSRVELADHLPTWGQMSELDQAEAEHHVYMTTCRRKDWTEWPCRYLDDPNLSVLSPSDAHRHAASVVPGDLAPDQQERLHEVWSTGVQALRRSRDTWGVRYDGERLWTTGDERYATLAFDTSRADLVELVRRHVPGGPWHVVDTRSSCDCCPVTGPRPPGGWLYGCTCQCHGAY